MLDWLGKWVGFVILLSVATITWLIYLKKTGKYTRKKVEDFIGVLGKRQL